MRRQQDQHSGVFYELSVLVLNLLRSHPSTISFSDDSPVIPPDVSMSRRSVPAQISPAGFASLLLGISLALMLCGSVTFFIGFILMPWVIGLVMVLYVAGLMSALSMMGRSILCHATAPSNPPKDIRGTFDYKGFLFCLQLVVFPFALFLFIDTMFISVIILGNWFI